MRLIPLALLILAVLPARADTPPGDRQAALDQMILPGHEAQMLAKAAEADCPRLSVPPAYDAARRAWAQIGDLSLGPTEQAVLTIAF
ncbi:hypothetical protein FA743_11475 [Paracoccus gahaiensis]|uniref:Uncharacterized protein n=1 Tax=Paracoccus gahaiensis TaxID=1706839 RepID=A0A4U0R8F3_9RHOB|nr:hypothetical protein [Paracoccus gahaiensis]TJZ91401.1 hypothetical protein FA743_11475 [Paracoccus gahaiensis]